MMVRKRVNVAAAGVFFSVVGLDQLTKTLVLRHIGPSERVELAGPISLVKRYNTGVAFSLGNGSAITAWLVTLVVAALIVWAVRTLARGVEPLFAVLLAVIVGGGVGNQIDRLFRGGGWNKGAVVDFIDVGVLNFAIFNVADMALSVGCAVLAVWTLLGGGPVDPKSLARSLVPASSSEDLRSTALPDGSDRGAVETVPVDDRAADFGPTRLDGAASPGQSSGAASHDSSTKGL
jgi:signal peptidase II